MHKTKTEVLIVAMHILAKDIQSGDGVANAAIKEAADRLEELDKMNKGLILSLRGKNNVRL